MSVEMNHRINPNLIRTASRGLLHLLSKGVTLMGEENIPKAGPAIVAVNHTGIAESLPPYVYLPETPVAFTKKDTLEIPVLGSFLKRLGSIPVRRDKVDVEALKDTQSVLVDHKGIIFICPEGTRGRDRDGNRTELKEAKSGVIYMAQKAANTLQQPIPISPWAIWGTEGVFPQVDEPVSIEKKFALRLDHVVVAVGEPYYIYPSDQRLTKENMALMRAQTDALMRRIRDMLPPKYHGYYADRIAVPSL